MLYQFRLVSGIDLRGAHPTETIPAGIIISYGYTQRGAAVSLDEPVRTTGPSKHERGRCRSTWFSWEADTPTLLR